MSVIERVKVLRAAVETYLDSEVDEAVERMNPLMKAVGMGAITGATRRIKELVMEFVTTRDEAQPYDLDTIFGTAELAEQIKEVILMALAICQLELQTGSRFEVMGCLNMGDLLAKAGDELSTEDAGQFKDLIDKLDIDEE